MPELTVVWERSGARSPWPAEHTHGAAGGLRSSMGARTPVRMWAVGRNELAAGGARLHEGRAAWRVELVGGALGGEDGGSGGVRK
jgi:hypothetical protein